MESQELTQSLRRRDLLRVIGEAAGARFPHVALLRELRNRTGLPEGTLLQELDALAREGLIITGRTINDTYIKFADQ